VKNWFQNLLSPIPTGTATARQVTQELSLAKALYAKHPDWTVLDVTHKGVEETAARIMKSIYEVGAVCALSPPDPQLKGAWYPGGFNPCPDRVKTRFQDVPFKTQRNVRRYCEDENANNYEVGLCTLNQVDP
jgi:hypothetical protein